MNKFYKKISDLLSGNRGPNKVPLKQNFCFIHIPKTAGTSLRSALDEITYVKGDYGVNSESTSEELRELVYERKLPGFELAKEFKSLDCFILSGHYPLSKYSYFFELKNTFSLIREPTGQVLSHYKHFKTHNGYKGDFEEFVKNRQFSNCQSRALSEVPAGCIGFIGISEQYDESLSMLESKLALTLPNLTENKAKMELEVSGKMLDLIKKYNKNDLDLYKETRRIFLQRRIALKKNNEWVYGAYGLSGDRKTVKGVAWYESSEEAVPVHLVDVNNKVMKRTIANKHSGLLAKYGLPRDRFVEFEFKFHKPLAHGFKVLTDKELITLYKSKYLKC